MIPTGAKVYVATRPVDFRKGPDGLAALVRDTGADPFSGALYVFRAKRADREDRMVGRVGHLPVLQAVG
jgi:transposase|nr:IS66 family insertion sequence element accessory protein TnpB [Mesorhizobium sp. Root172]